MAGAADWAEEGETEMSTAAGYAPALSESLGMLQGALFNWNWLLSFNFY